MPTRCHMGSHEMTKIKRCIKANLAALSVLTQGALPAAGAAALTGGAGQRRWDAAAPRRAGEERREGRSKAKALDTVQTGCCSAWWKESRAAASGSRAEVSALSRSQSRMSFLQLRPQSSWQQTVKLCGQGTGRGLSPMRDPVWLHELPQNFSPESKAENMRQVNFF